MQGTLTRLGLLSVIAMFVAVACSGGGATPAPATAPATSAPATSAPATSAPATDTPPATDAPVATEPPTDGIPSGIAGNVDVHGSSTVAPISNAVAEDLADPALNPDFTYFVGDEGTGAGFADFFCVDGSDISDASRPMRASDPSDDDDEEADICAANGVEWVELKVAYDGIAVITSVQNPLTCLTFADLYALMGPESDAVANWNDAEALAQQLGSTTDLPDAALSITAPGDESGTYDSFIELVMLDFIEAQFPDDPDSATHLRTPGSIYVASPNDNVIIQGVGAFPTSLGFVGLSYAEENTDTVKMLQVDGGDGCIAPTIETVSDGSYPISRPLFIYPSLGRAATNPAIVAYVDYYLSDMGIANAAEVGYVPLPADELETTRAAWTSARP